MTDLRLPVGDIARHPGARRRVERVVPVPGLASGGTQVPEHAGVGLDLHLEGVTEGVVVSGHLSGRWEAECSRCLEPVRGPFALDVHELFHHEPIESETYPLDHDEIDLEPMVRDAVVLELPGAPVCADDCLGLCPSCGANRNDAPCECVTDDRDPRWAVLDQLHRDDPEATRSKQEERRT